MAGGGHLISIIATERTEYCRTSLFYFSVAAAMNYHKPGVLKQQKFILSHVWVPEVQKQGVCMAALPPKVPGGVPSSFLPTNGGCRHRLACDCIHSLTASAFACLSVSFSVS